MYNKVSRRPGWIWATLWTLIWVLGVPGIIAGNELDPTDPIAQITSVHNDFLAQLVQENAEKRAQNQEDQCWYIFTANPDQRAYLLDIKARAATGEEGVFVKNYAGENDPEIGSQYGAPFIRLLNAYLVRENQGKVYPLYVCISDNFVLPVLKALPAKTLHYKNVLELLENGYGAEESQKARKLITAKKNSFIQQFKDNVVNHSQSLVYYVFEWYQRLPDDQYATKRVQHAGAIYPTADKSNFPLSPAEYVNLKREPTWQYLEEVPDPPAMNQREGRLGAAVEALAGYESYEVCEDGANVIQYFGRDRLSPEDQILVNKIVDVVCSLTDEQKVVLDQDLNRLDPQDLLFEDRLTTKQLENYHQGLVAWRDWFDRVEVYDFSDEDRHLVYQIIMSNSLEKLELISLDRRLDFLEIVAKGPLVDAFFSSTRTEAAVVRVLKSFKTTEEAESLIQGMRSIKVEEQPLFQRLLAKMHDFGGTANYTFLSNQFQRLTLLKHGVSPSQPSLQDYHQIPEERHLVYNDQRIFSWGVPPKEGGVKYKPVEISPDGSLHIEYLVCEKTRVLGVEETGGLTTEIFEVCMDEATHTLDVDFFDLITLDVVADLPYLPLGEDPTFGLSRITYAGYLDYLLTKKGSAKVKTIANITLTTASIAFGVLEVGLMLHVGASTGRVALAGLNLGTELADVIVNSEAFKIHICGGDKDCDQIQTIRSYTTLAQLAAIGASAFDVGKNWSILAKGGKVLQLRKALKAKFANYPDLVRWIDEVDDVRLLSRLDGLPPSSYGALAADLPKLRSFFERVPDGVNSWKRVIDAPDGIRLNPNILDDVVDWPVSWNINRVGNSVEVIQSSTGRKLATISEGKITAPGRAITGETGNPILNRVPLIKGMEYDVDGMLYEVDDLGRVFNTSGDLDDMVRVRLGNQQIRAVDVKDGVRGTDQGGHIIGARFFGAGEQINYYPQSANLNQGAWKTMENGWANAMVAGKDVKVEVKAIFNSSSGRPDKFEVRYSIDGQPFLETFDNL